jgi:mono/diheme cytochrome c family protein
MFLTHIHYERRRLSKGGGTACHNRVSHLISPPVDTVDQLMARGSISPDIPEIRRKAVEVYHLDYPNVDAAQLSIAELSDYYEANHPDFFSENKQLIATAIVALQEAYLASVFPEQKADWTSHPDNIGHFETPGCFRCHDGKHLNANQEAIRLECNLCHSVPVVTGPNDFVAEIKISRGLEPSSHLNPNWIGLHRDVFDPSCSNCHTTDDPGGTSNTSFCSNSACHGIAWVFAGFDVPSLRDVLRSQLDLVATEPELEDLPLSYKGSIGSLLEARCGACHGEGGIQGLDVTAYDALLQGGTSGLAIISGDPKGSLLVQRQTGDEAHFGQFSAEELAQVIEWITAGAPE